MRKLRLTVQSAQSRFLLSTRHITMSHANSIVPDGSVVAIMPAGGNGRRFGSVENKLFALLGGEPLWTHSASRLIARPEIGRIIMPVSADDRSKFETRYADQLERYLIQLVDGGAERNDSVRNGLDAARAEGIFSLVAVHDAARPLVTDDDIAAVISVAAENHAALLVASITGTIKFGRSVDEPPGTQSCRTIDRRNMWTALTPQVFEIDLLCEAYDRHRGRPVTDDAEMVERCGVEVCLVPGRSDNLKITHPEDLAIAEAILAGQRSE